MISLATESYQAKIKANISDAIGAINIESIDFETTGAADDLISLIEETNIQLGLSFDSNIEMMQFIDAVEGDIELESCQLNFEKCESYKDAMLAEFNAYMGELVNLTLSDFVEVLVEKANLLIEVADNEFGGIELILVAGKLMYHSVPHSEEAIYNGGGGRTIEYDVWRQQRVIATKTGNSFVVAVVKGN